MSHQDNADQFSPSGHNDIRPIETGPRADDMREAPLKAAQPDDDESTAPAAHHSEKANRLAAGDEIDLTEKHPTLRKINVAVGWDQKVIEENKIDLDLSCFLLNKDDVTREDDDFIFYNNENGCEGAVRHLEDNRTGAGDGDDETMTLDLNAIPFDVLKIVFVLSTYDSSMRGHHIGMTRHVYIRMLDQEDDHELLRYEPTEELLDGQTGAVLLTMIREGARWIVQASDTVTQGGLAALADQYGIIVAEQTG